MIIVVIVVQVIAKGKIRGDRSLNLLESTGLVLPLIHTTPVDPKIVNFLPPLQLI